MQMEFWRFGRKDASLPWFATVLTFDELSYQAKTALSGFYISNENTVWPRRPNVPEEVRIVDSDGVEVVTYTIRDLLDETQRTLLPAEAFEEVETVSFSVDRNAGCMPLRQGKGRNSKLTRR